MAEGVGPGTTRRLNSLRLLPSGSDRVGESAVRPTPAAHMRDGARIGKIRAGAQSAPVVTNRATDSWTPVRTESLASPPPIRLTISNGTVLPGASAKAMSLWAP